jgi:hypothetical protein
MVDAQQSRVIYRCGDGSRRAGPVALRHARVHAVAGRAAADREQQDYQA